MLIGLGTRLVQKRNRELTTHMAGTVSSRSSGQGLYKNSTFSCQLTATLNKVGIYSVSKL